MFKNILTDEQKALLPLIDKFAADYYLVGGTAIALQIGHRRSVDFDLFTEKALKRKQIKSIIEASGFPTTDLLFEAADQLHIVVNTVKTTFFQYPFEIQSSLRFENIRMPSLLDLAAMKAYALGGRAKWKDYIDLYFILLGYHTFDEIVSKAKELYKDFFNDKLLKEQLSYFDDVDYTAKR
jgi:hypothetical protein